MKKVIQEDLPEVTDRTEDIIAKDLRKRGYDFRGIPTPYNGFMKCKNCKHFKRPILHGHHCHGHCSELDLGTFNVFRLGGELTVDHNYICAKYESR